MDSPIVLVLAKMLFRASNNVTIIKGITPMLSQYKKFHDDTIQTFSKLPHLGVEQILFYIKNNKITLGDVFTYILTDEKIQQCIKITYEAFNEEKATMALLYQTETYLQELKELKRLFLSKTWDNETKSVIPLDQIDLMALLTPPPLSRIFPHNQYYNVLSDTKDMHHIKHYQTPFIDFTKTTLDMMEIMIKIMKDNTRNLSFYLLANIHQYVDMEFSPKRKSYLFSILFAFKGNRFNHISEYYASKALLQMIIRFVEPKFKTLIENSDFEDVQIFQQQLIHSTNFAGLDEKDINKNENQSKALTYIQTKEAKYNRLLLNLRLDDKQILKLVLKLGALQYAKEKILMGEPALTITSDMKCFFGNDIFKHRFKQKNKLQKKIEKLAHLSHFGIFRNTLIPTSTVTPVKAGIHPSLSQG